MSEFKNDTLQPIPDDEIPAFIEILKTRLPITYRAHHFLLMQYKRKQFLKKTENQQLIDSVSARSYYNLFTHRYGNRDENCTIVGITKEGNRDHLEDYTLFIYSLQENNQELNECISETRRIDWDLGPLFLSTEDQHIPCVEEVLKKRKIEFTWVTPNIGLWLPREKAVCIEYTTSSVPDDVYIKDLTADDARIVDDNWFHKSKGTYFYNRTEIELNWGVGVFKKDTNQLVSWALLNDHYAMGTLATLNSEQGKGYGKLVTQVFCKWFLEREDLDVIAFVKEVNNTSRNLFEKLGFKKFLNCAWAKINRKC